MAADKEEEVQGVKGWLKEEAKMPDFHLEMSRIHFRSLNSR